MTPFSSKTKSERDNAMANFYSNFRSYSASFKSSKRTLRVLNFLGNDFTNVMTNVNYQRGIHSRNYMWISGMAQKRYGYEVIARIGKEYFYPIDYETGEASETAKENPNRFNAIWNFVADDGENHAIAHIGHLLYEIKWIGEFPTLVPIFETRGLKDNCSYELTDYRSFATAGQKRLWICGGEKFLMLSYKKKAGSWYPVLEQVANSDYAYVPTTSIAITYNDAKVASRSALDYPNLLSAFRQNLLLGGVGKSENTISNQPFFEYVLDAPIVPRNEEDMFKMELQISYSGKGR